jgi:hypothetical protein
MRTVTPFIFRVNKKGSLLSGGKSIECSPSTGGCRIFCAIRKLPPGIFSVKPGIFLTFSQQRGETGVNTQFFGCENLARILLVAGFASLPIFFFAISAASSFYPQTSEQT